MVSSSPSTSFLITRFQWRLNLRLSRRQGHSPVSLFRKLYHQKPSLEVAEDAIPTSSVRSPLQSPSKDVDLHCTVGRHRSVMISHNGSDRDDQSSLATGSPSSVVAAWKWRRRNDITGDEAVAAGRWLLVTASQSRCCRDAAEEITIRSPFHNIAIRS
ncbi:hypothetical protein TIFTF001_020896 [Ficus carica]|uniref:Uncharacterized protein n=1 Tax=Ficus carica TaxID=3494 RepID=A0AA88DE38_FICCA|nr:hypothetical protein TIFTF001_020896 [Ficus carica]